jgi:hypothetical protein
MPTSLIGSRLASVAPRTAPAAHLQREEGTMDIEQARTNLYRLQTDGAVVEAHLGFGGYGDDISAFISLVIEPPFSAEREQELTRRAREAVGLPTAQVVIEYGTQESVNGRT